MSTYTFEIIVQIEAIPDEDIEYTEDEIAWMHRAIQNLDYMFSCAKYLSLFGSMSAIILRKAKIEMALAGCEQQQRRSITTKHAD